MPIGLITTTLMLFLVAIANLFSKQIATIYGMAFTVGPVHRLHDLRTHQHAEVRQNEPCNLEEFNLDISPR